MSKSRNYALPAHSLASELPGLVQSCQTHNETETYQDSLISPESRRTRRPQLASKSPWQEPSLTPFEKPTLLLLLTTILTPALKAVHTDQAKSLRRLLARAGTALELRAHSTVRLCNRAVHEGHASVNFDTSAAGELVHLVVTHLDGDRKALKRQNRNRQHSCWSLAGGGSGLFFK